MHLFNCFLWNHLLRFYRTAAKLNFFPVQSVFSYSIHTIRQIHNSNHKQQTFIIVSFGWFIPISFLIIWRYANNEIFRILTYTNIIGTWWLKASFILCWLPLLPRWSGHSVWDTFVYRDKDFCLWSKLFPTDIKF